MAVAGDVDEDVVQASPVDPAAQLPGRPLGHHPAPREENHAIAEALHLSMLCEV